MVNSDCIVLFLNPNIQLVRRISNNYVELHIFLEYFFDWFVNKRIGVGLAGVGAEVFALTGAAVFAATLRVPRMATAVVAQITLHIMKSRTDAVLAVGQFGTVEGAAAHLGGEVGTGDAEDLPGHDVVDALLQIGDLLFETRQQSFGDLAQEDPALAAGVEEARLRTAEQLLRQQIEHTVGQLGRGEDLVAAEVGQAIEDVWTIVCHIDKVGYNAKGYKCVQVRQSFALRLARRKGCTGGFG